MQTKEKLDLLLPKIQNPEFIKNTGLGNELGFHIFDYEPKDELLIRDYVKRLVKKLNSEEGNINTVELDLFDILIQVLKSKNVFEKAMELEHKQGSQAVQKAIGPILTPEAFNTIIEAKVKDAQLILLTGVGKAFPLVRSHTVLNNLHYILDKVPVIMFFPGKYNKLELRLFNKFKDDNYYRAFKIIDND